jgi:SNF2 family DNA or RNA helicase
MTTKAAIEAATSDSGLSWPRPLFPYQRTGVRALLDNPSLLLADEMGLGKTIQAIAALRCLFAARETRGRW